MNWVELAKKIYELAPEIEITLEKKWLFDEANKAHQDSTHPNGATPLVAMLLKLAEAGHTNELKKCAQILTNKKAKKSKRIKELKGRDACTSGVAWQALSELTVLDKLIQNNPSLEYDETALHRTPDFVIPISEKRLGIEHTAPDEGSYMKEMRESVAIDLRRATNVTKLFNVLKGLRDSGNPDVASALTSEELEEISQSLGLPKERGKSQKIISKETLEREIDRHEIEEVSVFSGTPYALNRDPDLIKSIRYIRSLKLDGEQVKECDYKVLAISLPGHLYQRHDLERITRLQYPNDPDLVRLHSGVVWSAILGRQNDSIYLGALEAHLSRGMTYATRTCDADGILIGETSSWQAVIISIFSTHLHLMETPNAPTAGGVLATHNLSPYCYLFLRKDKNSLPSEIVEKIKREFKIEKVFIRDE